MLHKIRQLLGKIEVKKIKEVSTSRWSVSLYSELNKGLFSKEETFFLKTKFFRSNQMIETERFKDLRDAMWTFDNIIETTIEEENTIEY